MPLASDYNRPAQAPSEDPPVVNIVLREQYGPFAIPGNLMPRASNPYTYTERSTFIMREVTPRDGM